MCIRCTVHMDCYNVWSMCINCAFIYYVHLRIGLSIVGSIACTLQLSDASNVSFLLAGCPAYTSMHPDNTALLIAVPIAVGLLIPILAFLAIILATIILFHRVRTSHNAIPLQTYTVLYCVCDGHHTMSMYSCVLCCAFMQGHYKRVSLVKKVSCQCGPQRTRYC